MKVIIVALFMLISVSYSCAQVNSPQGIRSYNQATGYITTLKNQAVYRKNILRNKLVATAKKLFNQLAATKNQLNSRFGTFGQLGRNQKPIWTGDIDSLTLTVEIQLNTASVDAILTQTLINLRALILDPRNPEIQAMQTAINEDTVKISCWDNNKNSVQVITTKLIKDAEPIIDEQLTSVTNAMILATATIKALGDVFNNDLAACKSADVCGNEYVTDNYAKLLQNITTQNTNAGNALRTSILNIFNKVRALALAAVDEYKAGPKTQIQKCLDA